MSSSTFKILKQCQHCGQMFEAQKVSTKYCSHRCNSGHYKLKLKLAKKGEAEKQLLAAPTFKPKVGALGLAEIKDKEFLTVKDVALLFGCSVHTIYKLIEKKGIEAVNISERKTLIKRANIDKLFN